MAFVATLLPQISHSFYLPGVSPQEFAGACLHVSTVVAADSSAHAGRLSDGDKVDVKVNMATSTKTQLPYEHVSKACCFDVLVFGTPSWHYTLVFGPQYYFPFCQPAEVDYAAENLGEVLRGDRILNSAYEVIKFSCEFIRVVRLVVILLCVPFSFPWQHAPMTKAFCAAQIECGRGMQDPL